MHNKIYIILVSLAFGVLAVVFLFLPRSKYSELEKRDLATFPEFSMEKIKNNTYTKELSTWFSDSEPYRDGFMTFSMMIRDFIRFNVANDDEEAVSFHAMNDDKGDKKEPEMEYDEEIGEYTNKITADEIAKVGTHGIIIMGKEPKVRAMMAFGGGPQGGGKFAEIVNRYAKEMPGVKFYAVVAPLASEFYTPDKAKSATKPQLPTIKHIYSLLDPGVKGVDIYTPLAQHVAEDIYLRTDHHWSPRGAFYAAQAMAKSAGVPFKGLDAYEQKVTHRVVGSMYGYSHDIAVKNSPEDFIYYVPKNINYTTTITTYTLNADRKVTGKGKPCETEFFKHHRDGNGDAYGTFMGSDITLTQVKTGTKNGRKALVLKDSYGNAVPGYLFYSFEEVHVLDFRYFSDNIKKYVKDHGITDFFFVFNIFNAYSPIGTFNKMLTQGDNSFSAYSSPGKESSSKETSKKESAPKVEKKENKAEKPKDNGEKKSSSAPAKEDNSSAIQKTEPKEEAIPAVTSSSDE